MFKIFLFSWFAAAGVAGTIQIGFESPSFAPGNINTQQGWSKSGNYDAQVTLAGAYEGSQSLRISNAIVSGSFGDQTFTPHLAIPAGEESVPNAVDTFQSSWYFKSVTGALQEGLWISVSADNGAGARMSYLRMADDAINGMNLVFIDFSGTPQNFQSTMVANHLDRTVWHRIDMNMYFPEGPTNDLVQVFLDGQLLITGTSWEDYSRSYLTPEGNPGPLGPVNSLLFRSAGTAAPATLGAGFFIDDITLTSFDTPEPGGFGCALAGILGLLAWRVRTPRS